MADTTYRTQAVINAGNRRRFYARFAEMCLEIRDTSPAAMNLVSVSQDGDGRVRIVLNNPVSSQLQARWLVELHPNP